MLKFCFLYFRRIAGHRISPLDICTVKYLKVWNVVESWLTHLFLKLDACLRSRPECQWQLSHKIHTPHYFILELEILCHIPHYTILPQIQVYILNLLSLTYCGQCAFNGICILMSWIDLDFPRMEKPLLHLSKCVSHVWQVQKSGPHCPFTQLFDQCRDVVDFWLITNASKPWATNWYKLSSKAQPVFEFTQILYFHHIPWLKLST